MLKKFIYKTLGVIISVGIGIPLVFFVLVYNGFFGKVPSNDDVKSIINMEATLVYDVQGKVIGKYYIQDRTPISLENVPQDLINALIATEDKRFYDHGGIDVRSLLRVAVKSVLMQQSSSGGGSTITLQLAKNLFPRKSYNFLYYPINKSKEAIIASRIEKHYSKDEILELYLNTVSFGEDVYGIEAASLRYFNRHASNLTTEQAATLVGMLKATTYYNPASNPETSLSRRNVVLTLMVNGDYLEPERAEKLKKKDLGLDYQPPRKQTGAYLMASLRKKLNLFIDDYNNKHEIPLNLMKDGLRVYTTIDKTMQQYAEVAMEEHMISLQKLFDKHWYDLDLWKKHTKLLDREIKKNQNSRTPAQMQERREMLVYGAEKPEIKEMSPIDSIKFYLQQLQAGFVALDPYSGGLKAWVGGIDHQFFPYDHIETRAKRQVGSTFKPIVYATALQNGISPCNYYKAKKVAYDVQDGEWSPSNDDADYEGKYTMEGALEES
ncbi:MAG: transglycosylase domain-containing protein, partial [Bacteroidota bacterium]